MNEKFKELVAQVLEIDVNRLSESSNTSNISEWDSLLHWEIIAEIERTYKIKFTMSEAAAFKNLGEIYAALQGKI
ncbi:MAG: acyl carrier protein [Deferribacteraceae bacterium]|jgi:acyl carrier protein|nr:acyl carrier protein [Deferribacteraceae bacterium]